MAGGNFDNFGKELGSHHTDSNYKLIESVQSIFGCFPMILFWSAIRLLDL